MSCRPHGTIIGMLALYNIISTVISLVTSGSFFFRQKQQLWSLTGRAFSRCWRCISRRRNQEPEQSVNQDPEPYINFTFWSFTMSVLGSIAISLSAPLLTGIMISKSHPTANTWVLIEQWSTRPRATMFVIAVNLIAACSNHKEMIDEGMGTSGPQKADGYLETSITAVATELFISFFGIKFLWSQTTIPSLDEFPSSSPCTYLGSAELYGDPSNCPNMQIGADGLKWGIFFNGFLSIIFLLVLSCGETMSAGGKVILYTLLLQCLLFTCIAGKSGRTFCIRLQMICIASTLLFRLILSIACYLFG